jgi:7-carboxy-7-deazaguanine synthase
MIYQIAELFKSVQGEGLYSGTPMAFIRFVGCSVGKKICQHCDTDFETMHPWHGGGEFSEAQLLDWVGDYEHVCLTGGEPLDQDLEPLVAAAGNLQVHMETWNKPCATQTRLR